MQPPPERPKRVYPSREAVMGRFSLLPPQPCANAFIMAYIAHFSVRAAKEVEAAASYHHDYPGCDVRVISFRVTALGLQ